VAMLRVVQLFISVGCNGASLLINPLTCPDTTLKIENSSSLSPIVIKSMGKGGCQILLFFLRKSAVFESTSKFICLPLHKYLG